MTDQSSAMLSASYGLYSRITVWFIDRMESYNDLSYKATGSSLMAITQYLVQGCRQFDTSYTGVRGIGDFKLLLHQYAQYWTPSSVKFDSFCNLSSGTDDLLSPLCADSQAPDEQRVITGLNGFNKPDNERSAVRQSETRVQQLSSYQQPRGGHSGRKKNNNRTERELLNRQRSEEAQRLVQQRHKEVQLLNQQRHEVVQLLNQQRHEEALIQHQRFFEVTASLLHVPFSGMYKNAGSYLLIKAMLTLNMLPGLTMQGSKAIDKYVDSLSFLTMRLADMPKALGFEDSVKGFFPHGFSSENTLNYVGPHPPPQTYGLERMTGDGKREFETWYEALRYAVIPIVGQLIGGLVNKNQRISQWSSQKMFLLTPQQMSRMSQTVAVGETLSESRTAENDLDVQTEDY
ncbi:hypothetical protein F2P81_023414 [Scophthalmus maximus]|uniref:Uncharacterized protein n=1 Tax=Scophthalmus maximus TaxID=52904 RepID=A0A6A4RZM4_SCOMX|nr:hypothetical protein F2P81_023414 [Scophthalmus maximus]